MLESSDSEFEDLAAAIKGDGGPELDLGDDASSDSDSEVEKVSPKDRKRIKLDPEESKRLDKFLFGDKEGFLNNLKDSKLFFEDVQGETDSGTSQNNGPVWHDSDDEEDKTALEGSELQRKRKFERIAGVPSWADLNKKVEADSDDEDDITKSVGHLSKDKTSSQLLRGEISFKRMKDINKLTKKEGKITALEFHPKSTVGVVAGLKGMVSMFAIDGRDNKKIHNIKYEQFPIHSCRLYNEGEELLVGSVYPYFHTYNLLSGDKQKARLPKGISNLKQFEFSPCEKYMAVVGEFGEVHLLHALTKELLCTFKQEYQSTSLCFSADSSRLFSHSEDNEVSVFSVRTQRVEHKFVDDGCVNGTTLTISDNGKFLATGSRQGYVNIYNYEDVFAKKNPLPEKAISNLTTEISSLRFNPSTEILGICSADTSNAVKLVHFPSATVFSNFPSQHDTMGKATVLNFSPASGFFAFGTIGGLAPLYRLRHYSNY